uniref:Glycoprotein n=1 Tax=Heterorhabditis bacteriophora TaxID=37862 RepID=A0A1I7WWI1_HETBA
MASSNIPIILNSKSKNTLEYQKTLPVFLDECGPTEQEVANPHDVSKNGAKTKFECIANANEILIRESFINVATNTPGACMRFLFLIFFYRKVKTDKIYNKYRVVGCTYDENDTGKVCKDGTITIWNAVKKIAIHTESIEKIAVINTDPGCTIHTTDDYVKISHRSSYFVFFSRFILLYGASSIILGKPIHNGNYVSRGSKMCNTQCFWGETITYDNIARNSEFHASVYVKKSCDWYVDVFMRVGIPMDFFKGKDQAFSVVHIQYTKQNRVILTTAFRERAVSVPLNHHAIAFFFSSRLSSNGLWYSWNGDGNVHALDDLQKSELDSKESIVDNNAPINKEKKDAGLDVEAPSTAKPISTTPDPEVYVPATTTPVQILVQGRIAHTGGENDSTASQNRAKGWSTWAVFGGFVTGSVSAFTIAGFILYICRRSFYHEWYRGMYQRYGCDASGVTGGTTGSQFGNTTTGASQMGTTLNATSNIGTITSVTTSDGTTFGGTTADGNTAGISAGDMNINIAIICNNIFTMMSVLSTLRFHISYE